MFSESLLMLMNWSEKFVKKFQKKLPLYNFDIQKVFASCIPQRETEYTSDALKIRGFIDLIEKDNGLVRVMDYKTSKKFDFSQEYMLQLSIYALMYQEKHNSLPHELGIYFLKDTQEFEKTIKATQELVEYAKKEIEKTHAFTIKQTKEEYPKNPSPLCKWSTGQCDFYELCFKKDLHTSLDKYS